MKQLKTISLIFCITIVLTACSSIPISSMWKLRNADPLESDPGFFKLAVISNENLELKDNSTSLAMSLNADDPAYNFKTTVTALVQVGVTESQLLPFKEQHERITIFSFDEESARQLRIAQSRIRSAKEKNIPGSASLNVTVDTGCINGPKPTALNANIYISFEPTQGFVKLMSNINLLENNDNFLKKCE